MPSHQTPPDLARRLAAEFLGTMLLVTVVVGAGVAAQRLTPNDVGLQLLENSTATFLGLTVLILWFGPVSGGHFNPVVSAADWLLGRRANAGLRGRDVGAYTAAQVAGGIVGAELANLMFKVPIDQLATPLPLVMNVLLFAMGHQARIAQQEDVPTSIPLLGERPSMPHIVKARN